ncbi:hypothetical protein ABZ131_14820, partial [Providencia rettgeri]
FLYSSRHSSPFFRSSIIVLNRTVETKGVSNNSQLPNYPTTQLLLTTCLIYLILFLFVGPLVMNITIGNGSSR